MGAEDPLFILYTSGSTGKPKGVLHTTGGYLAWASLHPRARLRLPRGRDLLVYRRCRLGHRPQYIVYGPLANGATSLMFEGVPNYPDAGRFWQVIDKHQVGVFYTAPTAIRALMREGDGR
jgi:acetyl-CoA synthetase